MRLKKWNYAPRRSAPSTPHEKGGNRTSNTGLRYDPHSEITSRAHQAFYWTELKLVEDAG